MKLALASTYLLLILVTPVVLIAPTPPTFTQSMENHRYVIMGGIMNAATQLYIFPPEFWTVPFVPTRPPYFTPLIMSQNITFSDPNPVTGVMYLTVPAETYVGPNYTWFDPSSEIYFRLEILMQEGGYGWLFTGIGSSPLLGDVDAITFNNNTGVYFFGPDGLAGTADDSFAGTPPQTGPDLIPGTPDDDFGTLNTTYGVPRTPDPPGSSILYLPTN